MDELALFAGAGGGLLGSELLGWSTRCAVEIDAYARRVLLARQRDGMLGKFPIWDDVKTFDGRPWRGSIDVVSGGFPCQDISAAGKGAGLTGARSGLFFEMLRIIDEIRPRFIFAENSPNLRTRGLVTVLKEFDRLGYDARWCVLGAWHAGAPHKRNRMWIVGHRPHTDGKRTQMRFESRGSRWARGENTPIVGHDGEQKSLADADGSRQLCKSGPNRKGRRRFSDGGKEAGSGTPPEILADTVSLGSSRSRQFINAVHTTPQGKGETNQPILERFHEVWKVEPDVGRVANGVASRVDRLKALGNGQVPAVAALAWQILTADL